MTVMSAHRWNTNADLIADVHQLFPLDAVRDVTLGRGNWWKKHKPAELVGSDITGYPLGSGPNGIMTYEPPTNFRALPDASHSWPVVAFDPPYLPQTTKQQSSSSLINAAGEKDFANRYGLHSDHASNADELRALIKAGLSECHRVTNNLVLLKCMNYVVGGKHRPQVAWAIADAEEIGLEVAAQFVHLKGAGPQPTGKPRTIRSPRANYSTLIVFKKRRTK